MSKKVWVKIWLAPVNKREILSEHEGRTLYRTSGPVKIIKTTPSVMEYQIENSVHTSYNFQGFYKPIGMIVTKFWDQDDLFKQIRPSNFKLIDPFLPKDGDVYFTGTPTPEKLIRIKHKKVQMILDENEMLYRWIEKNDEEILM